ncbi:hypothetical protein [uncultured Nocardioides sp.]|uniref:hypothetical protein n=1 Tax=uncultured Nocardioides sp. TaxID=198441 RepID=UPI0026379422|nr:hypothetical protein [uncultured Nocardioides sp.]
MRGRGKDDLGRADRRGATVQRAVTERRFVLVAAGLLMLAVGVFGYVLGDVPVSTARTLLPLQLVTPRTFGWLLSAAGAVTLGLAVQPTTVRLGYGVAVGCFAVMGAWFLIGWVSHPAADTRPLASAALYLFLTGALVVLARTPGRSDR